MKDIKTAATYSLDQDTLILVIGLMIRKYSQEIAYTNPETRPEVVKFLSYFRDEWIKKKDNSRWFQGSNPGHIITNNSCERGNRTIKENYTQGYDLGLEDLINKV